MNKKNVFAGLTLIVALFMVMFVVAGFLDNTVPGGASPADGQNVSGITNLSINMNSNATHGDKVTNVSFMWQLTSNHSQFGGAANNSYMANVTVQNTSVDQGIFNVTYDTSALPDGIYNLTIMVSNISTEVANDGTMTTIVNESVAINVAVDNTVPTVSFITATGGNYVAPTLTVFNVTINDATAGVANNVKFNFDNGSGVSVNVTANNGSGSWNVSLNASAFCGASCGTQTLRIFANDTASNMNLTETITFDVNIPTNVTLGADTINGKNYSATNTTVRFNVSVDNETLAQRLMQNVIFMFDNSTGNAFNLSASLEVGDNQTLWNVSYNVSALKEGAQVVTIFANDSMGHLNKTETITFTVDKSGPSISVTCTSSPTTGDTVTCTCAATDATFIVTGPYFIGGTSNSEATTAGSEGSYTSSSCYAVDLMGNSGSGTGSWTVTAASTGGSGSGGSSGGSGTSAAGQFSKKTWTSINAGETATLDVENGEIGLTEVSFAVKDKTYGAWVKVEKVSSLPSSVKSFSKKVYRNIKITENNVEEVLETDVDIEFKVTKAWLSEQGLGKNDIALFRYVEDKWVELKTDLGTDDGTYQHYITETPGFSYFLIGEKTTVTAAPEAEETAEETEEEAAEEEAAAEEADEVMEEARPSWPWIVLILVIIAIIVLAYWLMSKKK